MISQISSVICKNFKQKTCWNDFGNMIFFFMFHFDVLNVLMSYTTVYDLYIICKYLNWYFHLNMFEDTLTSN